MKSIENNACYDAKQYLEKREILRRSLKELQSEIICTDEYLPKSDVDDTYFGELERIRLLAQCDRATVKLRDLIIKGKSWKYLDTIKNLITALNKQDFFAFKNLDQIIFDKNTGCIFQNLSVVRPMSYDLWNSSRREYDLHGIGKGKWAVHEENDLIPLSIPAAKFRPEKEVTIVYSYKKGSVYNYPSFKCSAEYSNHTDPKNVDHGLNGNLDSSVVALPRCPVINLQQFESDTFDILSLHDAKEKQAIAILDYFIENDWIPIFEPSAEYVERYSMTAEEIKEEYDEYNRLYDIYSRYKTLQTELVNVEIAIDYVKEINATKLLSSHFDYLIELENYDLDGIQKSTWRYRMASDKWITNLLSQLDDWESHNLNLVYEIIRLKTQLERQPLMNNLTVEEQELFGSQKQLLQEHLDIDLISLRSKLTNLLTESKQLLSNTNVDTLIGLHALGQQPIPNFTLLAEYTATLCTSTLRKAELLDESIDVIKKISSYMNQMLQNHLIFVDNSKEKLVQIGLDSSIELDKIDACFNEWRIERLVVLKQLHSLFDKGLNQVIGEKTVIDIFLFIEQYQNDLDEFYCEKRFGIYITNESKINGDNLEKLEKEQQLTILTHNFIKQLESIIFSCQTTAQKIWLAKFANAWQQTSVNHIVDLLNDEQFINRNEIFLCMNEEFRKIQQQNLAEFLHDAQSYSNALDQREKVFATLMFKMRKAISKELIK